MIVYLKIGMFQSVVPVPVSVMTEPITFGDQALHFQFCDSGEKEEDGTPIWIAESVDVRPERPKSDMPLNERDKIWTIVAGKGGAWSIHRCEDADGMKGLRQIFTTGQADEMNFVLFSTAGVNGRYATIEDVEEYHSLSRFDVVTFVIVRPRILSLHYGNVHPETPEDFEWLKTLRASSHAAMARIGIPSASSVAERATRKSQPYGK